MTDDISMHGRTQGAATDNRFGQVPIWLSFHPGVSDKAVRLFAVLGAKYADKRNGRAAPGQGRLASDLGISDRQVRRLLGQLRDVGAVTWTQRYDKTNVYQLHATPAPSTGNPQTVDEQGGPDTQCPPSEEVRPDTRRPVRPDTQCPPTHNQYPDCEKSSGLIQDGDGPVPSHKESLRLARQLLQDTSKSRPDLIKRQPITNGVVDESSTVSHNQGTNETART